MVLLSLWRCRQLPWCCRLPERSLPGPRCSGVTGLDNTWCGACLGGGRRGGPGISRFQILECGLLWGGVERPMNKKPNWPGAARGGSGPVEVCARWCPTLPHPGGCSTIGAVRLSFRVRDGAGRFPVAVTTETTTWAVRQCSCDSVIRLPADTRTRTLVVCGWWTGLGVDRIVDASLLPYRSPAGTPTHARCVVLLGVLLFVLAY